MDNMKKEWIVNYIGGMVYRNGVIYFIHGVINAVLMYDCKNEKVSVLKRFPEEACVYGAFEDMCICNDRLYLFPVYADDIFYYDLNTHKYNKVDILDKYRSKMQKRKVIRAKVYNEFIFCVCHMPHIVIVIDTNKDIVTVHEILPQISSQGEKVGAVYYPFNICLNNGEMTYPYGSNTIIKFNIENSNYEVISLERRDMLDEKDVYSYISGIEYDYSNNLWLCDSRLRLYKVQDNEMENIVIPDELKKYQYNNRWNVLSMLLLEDSLYFILYTERNILRYNIYRNRFEWYNNFLADDKIEKDKLYSLCFVETEPKDFFVYDAEDKFAYIWNAEKGFINRLRLRIDFEYICSDLSLSEYYIKYVASPQDNLKEYIQIVKGEGYNKNQGISEDFVSCGKKIYSLLE